MLIPKHLILMLFVRMLHTYHMEQLLTADNAHVHLASFYNQTGVIS